MGFFKNVLSVKKFFSVLQGGNLSLSFSGFFKAIKTWFFILINVMLLFGLLFLFKCLAPNENEAKCIRQEESGANNIFEFDIAKNISSGGYQPEYGNYSDVGQSTGWVDTGFKTTGDNLIIYATGSYFPWGKALTQKSTIYHSILERTADGTMVSSLELKKDYEECVLNTNIVYSTLDNEKMRLLYENHLNNYTAVNPSNRTIGMSAILYEKGYDITGATKTQTDCIQNNNCLVDDNVNQNPIGCVLKNGAGIYLKIGENSNYAYHIINHQVPKLKKVCESDGACNYQYYKIGDKIETITIPFGLPLIVYNRNNNNGWIRDTQEDNTKIIPITSYDQETNYEFTTLEIVSAKTCEEENYTEPLYQTIGGSCYKSVVKALKPVELQNYNCPIDNNVQILHPNELCAPQKDQRIYVKTADTFYDDDEGVVKIIFTSGAKNIEEEMPRKMSDKGLQLSWIQYLAYKVIAPFIGDQTEEEDLSNIIQIDRQIEQIVIKHTKGNRLYASTYNNNYIIKTSKYGDSGIIIKTKQLSSTTGKYENVSSNKLLLEPIISNNGATITIKPKDRSITPISLISTEVNNSIVSYLIKIDNLDKGLFIKIRNEIMTNNVFVIIKILLIVWFVFSFGCGFLNNSKIIHLPVFTKDWKNLLILLWATDPPNYDLIDEFLWPALFHGAEALSTLFFEAGNSVYGSSMHADSTFDFFDTAVQTMTSKALWLKVSAFATDLKYFYIFILWFPLVGTGMIRFIRTIAGVVFGVVFTILGIGINIMLMPVYALYSLFPKHDGDFKKMMYNLVGDFIHYALELGFFGFMIGFVYQTFLETFEFDICWEFVFSIPLIFTDADFYNWNIVYGGDYVENLHSILRLLTKAIIFCITSIISVKFVGFAKMGADLFWKSTSGFGLSQGQKIGQTALGVVDTITSVAGEITEIPASILEGRQAVKENIKNISRTINDSYDNIALNDKQLKDLNKSRNDIGLLRQELQNLKNSPIQTNDTQQKIKKLEKLISKGGKQIQHSRDFSLTDDDRKGIQSDINSNINKMNKEIKKTKVLQNKEATNIVKNILGNKNNNINLQQLQKELQNLKNSPIQTKDTKQKIRKLEEFISINNKSVARNNQTTEYFEEITPTQQEGKTLNYNGNDNISSIIDNNRLEKGKSISNFDKTSDNIDNIVEKTINENRANETENSLEQEQLSNHIGIVSSDLGMKTNEGLIMNGSDVEMKTNVEGIGGVDISNSKTQIDNNNIAPEVALRKEQETQKLNKAKIDQTKSLMEVIKHKKEVAFAEESFNKGNITQKELDEIKYSLSLKERELEDAKEVYKKLTNRDTWEKKKK